jgi:glycosyltransferase involved in cell wall biosynthesis
LAGAIQRLHENPALRSELGAAARQRALTEFDERIVIEKTLAVYDELLSVLSSAEN